MQGNLGAFASLAVASARNLQFAWAFVTVLSINQFAFARCLGERRRMQTADSNLHRRLRSLNSRRTTVCLAPTRRLMMTRKLYWDMMLLGSHSYSGLRNHGSADFSILGTVHSGALARVGTRNQHGC